MKRGDEVLIVAQTHENLWTLGIDIVAQVGGVHTGIGGHLLLVERLHGLQGHVYGYAKFLIAFGLQGSEVEE